MILVPKIISYITKAFKAGKTHCFSIKTGSNFSSLLGFFFSQSNAKKKIYADVPEMFNFSPKTSIQKYPICSCWYNVFSTNVSDFYRYFTAKIKNFEPLYLFKQLSYTSTF